MCGWGGYHYYFSAGMRECGLGIALRCVASAPSFFGGQGRGGDGGDCNLQSVGTKARLGHCSVLRRRRTRTCVAKWGYEESRSVIFSFLFSGPPFYLGSRLGGGFTLFPGPWFFRSSRDWTKNQARCVVPAAPSDFLFVLIPPRPANRDEKKDKTREFSQVL